MGETAGDAIWSWSLAAYAEANVKAALLALQNRFGAQIPMLLWAAHAATRALTVTLDDARAARAALAPLSAHTRALRDARRQLPGLAQRLPAEPREAAVAHIAEAEIAMEQLELVKLAEQRTHAGARTIETLRANLAASLQSNGVDLTKHEPKAALESLVTAFGPHFTG